MTDSACERKTEFFLTSLFSLLKQMKLEYAVLHSFEQMPVATPSDVDMVCRGFDETAAVEIIQSMESLTGWKMMQKLWYDIPRCIYLVFQEPSSHDCIALDFLSDPRGLGAYHIPEDLLLAGRIEERGFYHVSPEVEFSYKLLKRCRKNYLKPEEIGVLAELRKRADSIRLKEFLESCLGPALGRELAELPPEQLGSLSGRLQEIHAQQLRLLPWSTRIAEQFWKFRRGFFRMTTASGAVVNWPQKTDAENLLRLADAHFNIVFRKTQCVDFKQWNRYRTWIALGHSNLVFLLGAPDFSIRTGRGRENFHTAPEVPPLPELFETLSSILYQREKKRWSKGKQ